MLARILRSTSIFVLTLVVAASSFSVPAHSASASEEETVRLIVELRQEHDELTPREVRRLSREIRRMSDRVPRSYTVDGEQVRARDLRRWRVIEVAVSDVDTTMQLLIENPVVVSVHPERIYEATRLPNDPFLLEQYGLVSSHPLASVKADAAWDVTTGSSSTVIAIIDGGVDFTHQDLRNKAWRNNDPVNGVDDDGNGFVDDLNGWDFVTDSPASFGHRHGTHVAGIAAAESNNGVGVAGADWHARLMSIRVLNSSGLGYEEDIVRGIDYAVAEGADIINLSLAGPASPAMLDAVENAYASGVLVVAAAGNSGSNTSARRIYPVCADRNGVNMVLGVGATDDEGEPKSFSNYGACVDVSAPGDKIFNTVPGNDYKKLSGTSMSSPLAAGIAGLYLAKNPGASPSQIISAMVNSLDPFEGRRAARWNARYKGRLNAARLLGVRVPSPSASPSPSPSATVPPPSGEAELTVSLHAPDTTSPGGDVAYTVRVHNAGSVAAATFRVEASVDRDLTLVGGDGCSMQRRKLVCAISAVGGGSTAQWTPTFAVDDDHRCRDKFRAKATVSMDERGRSRKQDRSDRVTTVVECE